MTEGNSVPDNLIDLFADILSVPPAELDDATSPDNLPAWDSVANLMLIAGIEETFSVDLQSSEIVAMKTIGAARALLREKGVASV